MDSKDWKLPTAMTTHGYELRGDGYGTYDKVYGERQKNNKGVCLG